ncbi:PAS domain S-box-containing protein [Chitinophaga dinghuensis]|uniref:histidine kinase n=1 Tax=Chitinophaga dinghuensis TaxID=1539050 RepID=A0A327VZD4_9BACT|nr:PAS domain S-box protein [Chitinophaga dinghuensis]RAJ80316.1 PAS domain S-box-containing protein [Chitinophaga dinghuensis]
MVPDRSTKKSLPVNSESPATQPDIDVTAEHNREQTGVKLVQALPADQEASRYHKMIEQVEDYAILMLDVNGIVLNWNKGAQKIKGYTEQEIVGKHFRIFYPKEDQRHHLPEQLIAEAVTKGKAIHEGWRIRKDGTSFWGSVVITCLHDEEDKIIGFSKVTRDLTERRNAEQKILDYTQQLETQNRELQKFAFAAAHDMKEPLRKIQLYNSIVLEAEGLRLNHRQKGYLLRAAEAASRMQQLIDDMLAFTRITEQSKPFEKVDLQQTLRELETFFKDSLDQVQGQMQVNGLPVVQGIPFQLRQLFENLISNSLKYCQANVPVRIVIESTLETQPHWMAGQPGKVYHIRFCDNGIGFEQHYAEKIFEMFERLHTGEQFPGTGIGLAICRKIAESHRGCIYASGKTGEGASFDIYLPV